MNQIGYILAQWKLKDLLKNCGTYRSAELGSDHFQVIANIDVKAYVSRCFKHMEVVNMYDLDKLYVRKRQGKSSM